MLDLRDEGYGFLRCDGYLPSPEGRLRLHQPGAALRAAQGRLRRGRVPTGGEQREVPGAAPHRHGLGMDPDEARSRPRFEDLTPLFPDSAAPPREAPATRTT